MSVCLGCNRGISDEAVVGKMIKCGSDCSAKVDDVLAKLDNWWEHSVVVNGQNEIYLRAKTALLTHGNAPHKLRRSLSDLTAQQKGFVSMKGGCIELSVR
ncbi:MAG: hypothetical protein S4CHLAM81_10460 [Chlamydiales bacterium]|nr:hypothetical protein [Chlamydiales bacterium]MCH9635824.1 hypothetical protein [Chlamydiales bacterium]